MGQAGGQAERGFLWGVALLAAAFDVLQWRGTHRCRTPVRVDLASLDREPESPIGNFSFHGCTGGVAAFKGRPTWECHGQGDELLFILA
jgi:hypothetical protein